MIGSVSESVSPLIPLIFAVSIVSQLLVQIFTVLFKLIYRPAIHFYPAGMIEVGFGTLGPNLTLFGTMQAVRNDFFVTEVEVSVQRMDSDTTHTLEWRALKPYVFGLEEEPDMKFELVSAFSLKKEQPFKYNIVFVDDAFVTEEIHVAKQVREAYQTFISPDTPADAPAASDQPLAERFYQQPENQKIAQDWQQKIYWRAGEYQLELRTHTNRQTQSFTSNFHLSELDAERLQGNVRNLILYLCGEDVRYDKAFASYQSVK